MMIGEIFKRVVEEFNPEAAGKAEIKYQFNISGKDGGVWTIDIRDGACTLLESGVENPDVLISMTDRDWKAVREGRTNSQMLFMQGKLKIKGDMNLAMKMGSIFPIR